MDTLDQSLLGLLRQNARAPVATLARKLGVSRGTVNNRLARLEDDGVIVGYTVRTAERGGDITAWMSIAVDGHETRRIVAQLLGEPAVVSLHDTNGRWDLMAELRVPDIGQMSQILERIRQIKGISASETSIHLKSYKLAS